MEGSKSTGRSSLFIDVSEVPDQGIQIVRCSVIGAVRTTTDVLSALEHSLPLGKPNDTASPSLLARDGGWFFVENGEPSWISVITDKTGANHYVMIGLSTHKTTVIPTLTVNQRLTRFHLVATCPSCTERSSVIRLKHLSPIITLILAGIVFSGQKVQAQKFWPGTSLCKPDESVVFLVSAQDEDGIGLCAARTQEVGLPGWSTRSHRA